MKNNLRRRRETELGCGREDHWGIICCVFFLFLFVEIFMKGCPIKSLKVIHSINLFFWFVTIFLAQQPSLTKVVIWLFFLLCFYLTGGGLQHACVVIRLFF